MIGSIISTIGGLAGGLFNNSAARRQNDAIRQMNATKIQTTVKDARKAGIHPLAALGSPVAGSWATPVGQPGLGDAVADGARAIGASMDKRYDPLTAAALDTERAKARNLDASTASLLADAQRATRTSALRAAGQTADIRDLVKPKTLLTGDGTKMKLSPQWDDTDKFTARHGEMADYIYGPQVWWADQLYGGAVRRASDRFEDRMERWHGSRPSRASPDTAGPR